MGSLYKLFDPIIAISRSHSYFHEHPNFKKIIEVIDECRTVLTKDIQPAYIKVNDISTAVTKKTLNPILHSSTPLKPISQRAKTDLERAIDENKTTLETMKNYVKKKSVASRSLTIQKKKKRK